MTHDPEQYWHKFSPQPLHWHKTPDLITTGGNPGSGSVSGNWGVQLVQNDFHSVLQKNCSFQLRFTKLTAVLLFMYVFWSACCLV